MLMAGVPSKSAPPIAAPGMFCHVPVVPLAVVETHPGTRNARLKGSGSVQEWNAQDETIGNVKATESSDTIQLPLELNPYETKFIVIKKP